MSSPKKEPTGALDAPVSLKNWQACLAVAQQRLANPSFRLDIQHVLDDLAGQSSVKGSASGLTVSVMDTGLDLVRLDMSLACDLLFEGEEFHVTNGVLTIITSFQVVHHNGVHAVHADLADPELAVNVSASGLDESVEGVIAGVLDSWLKSGTQISPIRLFSFNTEAGQAAGAQLRSFRVTTAFSRFSHLYSSFLLLMRESSGNTEENELSIDPHILPQGQTAVLWVSHDLLEKTGGASLVQAAELELAFRPRAMQVDIPNVSEKLRCWAKTIIDNVSLPESLDFTSMQMSAAGLMLSATPLSLTELDEFTACDPSADRPALVQQKTKELFEDCLVFYMKGKYRAYLLQKEKPNLPKEVLQVTKARSAWFEKFARLQLAGAIRKSEAKSDDPFSKYSDEKIEALLKEMSLSDIYAEQSARLYSLAFCVVRPRISLYMENPEKWKPLYIEYLTSETYADVLMAAPDPLAKIHDDNAKLHVFDLTGNSAKETLPLTVAAFMKRLSDHKWQAFVNERPDNYRAVLKEMLAAMEQDAGKPLPLAETSGPADRHDPEAVKNALRTAGGAESMADSLMTLLSKIAHQEETVTLSDAVANSVRQQDDPAGILKKCLVFAASAAVLVLLLHEIRKDVAEHPDGSLQTRDILEFSGGFSHALQKGMDIANLIKKKLGSLTVSSLKFVRWLGKTVIDKLAAIGKVTSRLVFNVKYIAALCGKVLSYAAAALSIYDAINSFKGGRIGEGVVATLSAAVALLGVLSIELSWSGPLSWALLAVSVILALISIFGFRKVSDSEDAVNELTSELAADGVAAH